jgi:hypothetical protein
MGYTTEFEGGFELSRTLTEQELNYINKFSETRRMKRDVSKLYELYKGEHGNPFLPYDETYGNEGEYFVGGLGYAGQENDPSIIDYNESPGAPLGNANDDFSKRWAAKQFAIMEGKCQPGLWCQWIVSDEGDSLVWDGGEKFYNYIEWLKYLINHFFSKWGVLLNGQMEWVGEDREDIGLIIVKDNEVIVKEGTIKYE